MRRVLPRKRQRRIPRASLPRTAASGTVPGKKDQRAWTAGLLTILVTGVTLLIHGFSPVSTSFDSRLSVPLALSFIHQRNADLDEYRNFMQREGFHGAECVLPTGQSAPGEAGGCPGGKYYSWYPIGAPLLATPIVFTIEQVARLIGPRPSAAPLVAGLFGGDLVGSRWLVERIAASTFVAVTTGLLFAIALRFLTWPGALVVALTFSFGTSAWSTASRALWQHGPSMMLLTIALWLLLKARERPSAIHFLSIPLALAYLVRPTNQIAVAVLTIYVFIYYRPMFVRYLAGAIPFALLLLGYNLSVYGRPFSTYYLGPPLVDLTLHSLLPFAGNLISPSRGLLVFSPVLIFSVAGMVVSTRRKWLYPLPPFLIAIAVLHWIVISLLAGSWWGGHSYGPRLFSDMLPLIAFFLIPVFQVRMRAAAVIAFAILLIASVLIHYRGATTFKVHLWNVEPVNIDNVPARVWDWKDPQFLHGLR